MAVRIELGACINCGLCRKACPTDAIRFFTTHHRTHVVEPQLCIDCPKCIAVCPEACIIPDDSYVHDSAELEAAKALARAWAAKQRTLKGRVRDRAAVAVAAVAARAST